MNTRILLSISVALAGSGFTARADSPQHQNLLALQRAQRAEMQRQSCPPSPACPEPCDPSRGKAAAQRRTEAVCPPCPECPDGVGTKRTAMLGKCPPCPECPCC